MQCPEMEGNDRRHSDTIIKTTEPTFYSCPFCLYTNTAEHSVYYHIQNHATVEHKEFTIFRCGLNCRKASHFHCCYCSATLIRRDQFIKHLSNDKIHTTTQPQLLPASTDPNADFAGSKLSAQETEASGKSVEPPQQVLGPILPTPQEPPTVKAPQATRSRISQLTEFTPESLGHYNMMLDFTEQLSEKLENLVLTFASYDLLSLDESEPQSVSHFCIGGRLFGQLKLTTFRYCRPTPYLAQVDTGLYKRMRWNVERLKRKHQAMEEYYFLCYEDMPITHEEADGDSQGDSRGSAVRMWSIGRWEQKIPDPDTEDIYHWIMCEVPRGKYRKLLSLGSNEPSSSSATDRLQDLLLSQQTTE